MVMGALPVHLHLSHLLQMLNVVVLKIPQGGRFSCPRFIHEAVEPLLIKCPFFFFPSDKYLLSAFCVPGTVQQGLAQAGAQSVTESGDR